MCAGRVADFLRNGVLKSDLLDHTLLTHTIFWFDAHGDFNTPETLEVVFGTVWLWPQ
jgi:hypothetical protein